MTNANATNAPVFAAPTEPVLAPSHAEIQAGLEAEHTLDLPALRPAKTLRHSERLRILAQFQELDTDALNTEEPDVETTAAVVEAAETALLKLAVDQAQMDSWIRETSMTNLIEGMKIVVDDLGESLGS